jgi:hypothetical protein
MVERYKGFQVLLTIGISFWFLVFPAYLHFSILDESDLTSCYPCFKNMDQDDSIVTAEKEKASGLNLIAETFVASGFSVEGISIFFPQISDQHLESLVLRC